MNEARSFEDLVREAKDNFQAGKSMAESARASLAPGLLDKDQLALNQKKAADGKLQYLTAELNLAREKGDGVRIKQLEIIMKKSEKYRNSVTKPSSGKGEVQS